MQKKWRSWWLSKALEASPGDLLGGGSERELWLDELVAIGATVPVAHQEILLNVARALAGPRGGRRKDVGAMRSNPGASEATAARKTRR